MWINDLRSMQAGCILYLHMNGLQIAAIIALLLAFGVDNSTATRVQGILQATTPAQSSPIGDAPPVLPQEVCTKNPQILLITQPRLTNLSSATIKATYSDGCTLASDLLKSTVPYLWVIKDGNGVRIEEFAGSLSSLVANSTSHDWNLKDINTVEYWQTVSAPAGSPITFRVGDVSTTTAVW